MVLKFIDSPQNILETVQTPLCLGNIYDFSVDYDAIAVDDTLGIHNYLMKKMT